MKFVHIADIHFDMPFWALSKKGLAENRRLDQRKTFTKLINYIKENNIEYLFIAGDLYENEYVRKSTIDYINNCFKEIPDTRIFITPGNHDPYLMNSYYNKYEWSENVHIFTKLDKVENKNINIYGYGFTDFYSKKIELPCKIDNDKINILIMHSDLNGTNSNMEEYNPVLESDIKKIGFDYVALGHIHKNNLDNNNKIIYPGSLIAGGFDELGEHGIVVGSIDEHSKDLTINFVKFDDKKFVEENFDISNISSKEELIEKINALEIDENQYYKIILVGEKNIEIDENDIIKYLEKSNIIKLKDKTKDRYDLEIISKEQSLRGIFVKELLNQINEENKQNILQSIYMGLDLM